MNKPHIALAAGFLITSLCTVASAQVLLVEEPLQYSLLGPDEPEGIDEDVAIRLTLENYDVTQHLLVRRSRYYREVHGLIREERVTIMGEEMKDLPIRTVLMEVKRDGTIRWLSAVEQPDLKKEYLAKYIYSESTLATEDWVDDLMDRLSTIPKESLQATDLNRERLTLMLSYFPEGSSGTGLIATRESSVGCFCELSLPHSSIKSFAPSEYEFCSKLLMLEAESLKPGEEVWSQVMNDITSLIPVSLDEEAP